VGSPPHDVNVVIADPVAPQVLFAGGDLGIYKSTDGGAAWRRVYAFRGDGFAFTGDLVIDPGNHLRLAALVPFSGTLIRSLDGGETWTPATGLSCPISNCGGRLAVDPTGSGTLLVAEFFLQISHDWGASFQRIDRGGSAVAFDPSHPGWIYAAASMGVGGSLALSTDYGATWTAKGVPPTIFSGILNIAVDPDQPNVLLATTPDGLYKSSDGGASWTRQTRSDSLSFSVRGHEPFAPLGRQCAPEGGVFAMGGGAGGGYQVAFSPDDGTTWNAPQLSAVTSVSTGPGCTAYITRQVTSDAFVAKLAPDGRIIWATYLGGADQDTVAGLALDAAGNAYVTGTTISADFPSTAARIGGAGPTSAFVTKLSSAGKLVYSVLAGGTGSTNASAIAVDGTGSVYVAGNTSARDFPVTPDAVVSTGNVGGFVLRLSADGSLAAATYLSEAFSSPGAVLADGGGLSVAGAGAAPGAPAPREGTYPAFVARLDSSLTHILSTAYIEGTNSAVRPTGLAADAEGNLYLAGETSGPDYIPSPGAYASPRPIVSCTDNRYTAYGGDVYLVKLSAADRTPVYRALLRAPCGMHAGTIVLDRSGAVFLALSTGNGMPLRTPFVGGPACGASLLSSAVAQITADGSSLQFATYLHNCDVPAIATTRDGTVYVGASGASSSDSAGVLRWTPAAPPAVALDRIANAFSGDVASVVPGGLYTLSGSGLAPASIDLTLKPSQDLPRQLGGVRVLFDGIAGSIVQVAIGRVIVAAPAELPALGRSMPGFTDVQVVSNGVASNAVSMPVAKSAPGLLTQDYPNPQTNFPDAYAVDEDGAPNGPDHPAAPGSTITLYATGLGATIPPVDPGAVARSASPSPVVPVYSSWATWGPTGNPPAELVHTVPGVVNSVFEVKIKIPNPVTNASGLQRVAVFLRFTVPVSSSVPPASNIVGIYVK
jgi:uncharacterized protein (TIGR03437 family)